MGRAPAFSTTTAKRGPSGFSPSGNCSKTRFALNLAISCFIRSSSKSNPFILSLLEETNEQGTEERKTIQVTLLTELQRPFPVLDWFLQWLPPSDSRLFSETFKNYLLLDTRNHVLRSNNG